MKKIKLPLEMAGGVQVRTLDELKENWDLEKVLNYYLNGKLQTWLADRYYTELADEVAALSDIDDNTELQRNLCSIFGIEIKEDLVDVEAVAKRNRKLEILRQYTADDEILKNIDKVAFNQEELADLLDEDENVIYLCDNKFSIPLLVKNKTYIGFGDVEAVINSKEYIDFDDIGIEFKDIKFNKEFNDLLSKTQESSLALAKDYESENDYNNAFKYYKIAAKSENMVALRKLAEFYEQGKGAEYDIFKAVELYKKAAEKGDVISMYSLGNIYSCTKNKVWNFYTAIEWYKKAADLGHSDAKRIFNLNKAFMNKK